MAPLRAFSLLASFLPTLLAQNCWRDTSCTGPLEAAFPGGPWEDNNFSPSSRTVSPQSVFPLESPSDNQSYPSLSTLQGNASALVFDFGKEVGGWVTLKFSTTGSGSGRLGLAFTEAKNWIGLASDSSNGAFARGTGDQACDDGALYYSFSEAGEYTYTLPDDKLRGGFRYMTLFLLTNASTSPTIEIEDISLEIGFEPTWSNLRAYQGYFHSNDEELNKIWYAGAYTLQTNAVPPSTGRWIPPLNSSWSNNGTMSNGSTVIVDGAKRDRAVWPGDMGIAVPSSFVSTGGLEAVVNALQAMYDYQNSDGFFPEAGPPLLQQGSDTYHCWTMIGTYNYILYTDDLAWLEQNWKGYRDAMEYVYGKVLQPKGLLNVTGTRDWARQNQFGNNTEANVILYHTLLTGARLADWLNDTDLVSTYTSRAETLGHNIITQTYDDAYGAFRDNATSTSLYPQDANSLALMFSLIAPNSSQAVSVSEALTENWTPIGPEAPELPNNISPFISSFELQGHFTATQAQRALDLLRTTWGWYLHNPNGTESTAIEGYLTNGSFGYRNYQGYSYDSAYVSHAHGWSAGPTYALTTFVLGLEVMDRGGSEWRLAPQFGDLMSVEGGFMTNFGKLQASWEVAEGGDRYTVSLSAPQGTTGTMVLPALPAGCAGTVMMNGESMDATVESGGSFETTVGGGEETKVVVERA